MANGFKFFTGKATQGTQRSTLKTVVLVGWLSLELICLVMAAPVIAQKVLEQKASVQAKAADHLINAGDRLSIRFPRQAELNGLSLVVRANGYITLPQIGEVRASGLMASQLQQRLEKAYSEISAQPAGPIEISF